MADNRPVRAKAVDRRRINRNERHEVRYWTEALDIDEVMFRDTVRQFGNRMKDVREAISRSLLFVSAMAVLGGCVGAFPAHSEVPVTDEQIAALPTGIDRAQLLQTLGPPSEEAAYKNLNETLLSWRLLLPSGQHWLFNAHLDPSGRVKYYSRTLDWPANLNGGSRM